MKYFRYFLPQLAHFTAYLLLFQSCILYKSTPISVEEASQFHNRYFKIRTIDGKTHELRWFDEYEESIFSIKSTTKVYVDIESIDHIIIPGANPQKVTLDAALSHRGIVHVYYKDNIDYGITKYNFMKIDTMENQLVGLRMLGKDTLTIRIPKKSILSIQVQDKAWSHEATALLVATSLAVAFGLYYFRSLYEVLD